MARTLTDKEREIIEGNRTLIVNTPEPLELGDPDPLPKRPEPLESIIERTLEALGREVGCPGFSIHSPGQRFIAHFELVAPRKERSWIAGGDTIREAVEAAAKKAMEGRDGA